MNSRNKDIIHSVYWASIQGYWNTPDDKTLTNYDKTYLAKFGFTYTAALEYTRKSLWENLNLFAKEGYLLFVITPEQAIGPTGFDNFLKITNIEKFLMFSRKEIQNKNYPDQPPRLTLYLFDVPKTETIGLLENLK